MITRFRKQRKKLIKSKPNSSQEGAVNFNTGLDKDRLPVEHRVQLEAGHRVQAAGMDRDLARVHRNLVACGENTAEDSAVRNWGTHLLGTSAGRRCNSDWPSRAVHSVGDVAGDAGVALPMLLAAVVALYLHSRIPGNSRLYPGTAVAYPS